MSGKSPLNVVLVSIILFLEGVVMLIFGILTLLFWLQLEGFLPLTSLLLSFSRDPGTFLFVFGSNSMLQFWININFLRLVFLIGWGIFSLYVFYLFSSLKSWAYYLAVLQSVVIFVFSALFLIEFMSLPLIFASLLVLIYVLVSEEIKDAFVII